MAKPPDDGFVAKGGFRDFWNQGKVPLGIYQETSSRGGQASQVLWMGLARPGEGHPFLDLAFLRGSINHFLHLLDQKVVQSNL